MQNLTIANKTFTSRLFLGTGKFSSNVVMNDPDVSIDMGFVQLMTIVRNMVYGSLGDDAIPNGRIILQEQYHPTRGSISTCSGIAFSRCETLKYGPCCPAMKKIC